MWGEVCVRAISNRPHPAPIIKRKENMSDVKIGLDALDFEDRPIVETVWAKRVGTYYRIDNIPFHAKSIALDDVVEALSDEGGLLRFERLIEESGNSTVLLVFFDLSAKEPLCRVLEALGCSWEGYHMEEIVSFNVPVAANYLQIVEQIKAHDSKLDYAELCLSTKHRKEREVGRGCMKNSILLVLLVLLCFSWTICRTSFCL